MKEILRNMATKRGQHDKIEGCGSLKPFKVFGYGGHILLNLIKNLSLVDHHPDNAVNGNFNAKVSSFWEILLFHCICPPKQFLCRMF